MVQHQEYHPLTSCYNKKKYKLLLLGFGVRPDRSLNSSKPSIISFTVLTSPLLKIMRSSAKQRLTILVCSHLQWNLKRGCLDFPAKILATTSIARTKEVRGHGVTLPKTSSPFEVAMKATIYTNGERRASRTGFNPRDHFVREAHSSKNVNDKLPSNSVVCFDDILIHSTSKEEHEHRLRIIL